MKLIKHHNYGYYIIMETKNIDFCNKNKYKNKYNIYKEMFI